MPWKTRLSTQTDRLRWRRRRSTTISRGRPRFRIANRNLTDNFLLDVKPTPEPAQANWVTIPPTDDVERYPELVSPCPGLLRLGVDYLASVIGARKLGATWRGMLGAVVGALIGILFSLPGIILGPFLGALLFEFLGGRDVREAALAGAGAMLGIFVGALGKVACSAAMIGLFAASVWSRSRSTLEAFLLNVFGGACAG